MANLSDTLTIICFTILSVVIFGTQPVEAFDGGDATALILGLLIGILGICACLGAYARKRSGQ